MLECGMDASGVGTWLQDLKQKSSQIGHSELFMLKTL